MDKNNQWVDDQMAKLNPESDWQPRVSTALARFEGRRAQGRFGGRWPRAILAAAIGLICVLTFPEPRAFAQRVVTPCVEACENLVLNPSELHAHIYRLVLAFHQWLGLAPPPMMPPPMIEESQRRAAPDFVLADATGATFHLSDYKGKVVLLNFWAAWCDPCKQEIPWFAEFQRTRAGQGFAVVGVSLDEHGWKAVRPAIESLKINYRVAVGDDATAQKFGGVDSLPETLLIDREGRIAAKHIGIVARREYEAEIDRLIGRNQGTT